MTNHHPNCEHVDASMIDVWKAELYGSSFIAESEELVRREAADNPEGEIKISKIRMHREIYENLPEFNGF